MAQSNWEADKMLDVYIYDYLVKRNLQATAKAFMAEAKVATDPVAIDAPGGFLFEWWSVFWDIFIARTNEKHSDVAAAYLEVQQMKAKEQFQQIRAKEQYQMQQLMQRHAQLQRRDANHPALNGAINGLNSDGILGSSAASSLAAKLYEERLKNPHSMDSEASPQLLDASRMSLFKSGANHPGQLIQGNPGNVPSALQQIQARSQQAADMKAELGVAQRSLPMDPSSLYGQGIVQGKSPIGGPGLNQGVSSLPLKGWPLTVEQYRTSLTPQVQKSLVSSANQFQVLSSQQQQQFLAQAQAQGNLGNSHSYGEMDPRKFRPLPRGGLNVKNVQTTGNDGSVGSPIQSSSQMSRQDQSEYLMKMQQSAQQSQEQLPQQHQLQQNQKKRKPTSSGAANSSGTVNTVGPSTSPPSTPSTNTPGDGIATAGNLPHVSGMTKSTMMYGTDGTGGLASSSNQMDDLENFGDIGSLDDNVESFLSPDDGDARDIFPAVKKSPTETNTESSKGGFSFSEIGLSRSSNKVLCCHFSSDGKLLASAGHERKILLWNMQNLQTESMSEEHTQIITDIRFRPDSTQLATSSFDRTVRLWNAAESKFSLFTLTGHSYQVTSLDFHPKKTDLLCSCDDNGEIRLWNISQCSGSLFMKGGSQQVRFQPRIGQFLAAAAENVVPIYDFETKRRTRLLQGHTKEVQSVCWDTNGDYLASVSHDVVKVWSLASGERIHELSSNGINFGSCVFHPTYPGLLIIGGYQSIQLWNMVENKTMTVSAHDSLIASLASSVTGTMASVSHDKVVKLWK